MTIYTLPVAREFQPETQAIRYPAHHDGYDVEQDFLAYVTRHPELQAARDEADWAYLPIFWTRWHLNHEFARTGRDELQAEVARALDGVARAFTVCLYDDGPVVDIGATVVLTAARQTYGIDIPTLCAPHAVAPTAKRYRAGFVGRLHTHPIRQAMAVALAHRDDVLIRDGDLGEQVFVNVICASHIALCPRGYGGSFRFYEAMQLGVVPLLLHDLDTRPFKRRIDWDRCSLYAPTVDALVALLDQHDTTALAAMSERAATVYSEYLDYQRWCPHALEELACHALN